MDSSISFGSRRCPLFCCLLQFLRGALAILFCTSSRRGVGRQRRQRLAEIGFDATAVGARIQPGQHALAIRAHPHANVERRAFRRFLERFRTSGIGGRSPHQLLCGESFHAGVRQNRRQRGWKSEAIRQHVFRAGFAELFAKPVISVKNLPNDRLGAGRVHVALFHRRSRREPSALIHEFLHLCEIRGKIFLHQAVAVGPAEIENVMRIFIEKPEIILHGLANIFVDDLRILPPPFRIEVGIADHVKSRLFAQIGFLGGLRAGRGRTTSRSCIRSATTSVPNRRIVSLRSVGSKKSRFRGTGYCATSLRLRSRNLRFLITSIEPQEKSSRCRRSLMHREFRRPLEQIRSSRMFLSPFQRAIALG